MSSVLHRTSRKQNNENLMSLQHRAPAATAHMLFGITSSASTTQECATSRGIPLLTKGKQFHIAQRGLKETSGFWYISKQPPRNSCLLAAAELRKWELESEQAPADELRFWKLTANGGVHAVTVPDALFAGRRAGQQNERDNQGQQRPVSPFLDSHSDSTNIVPTANSENNRGSKQHQERSEKSNTIGRDVDRPLGSTIKSAQQKQLRAHDRTQAEATIPPQGDVGKDVPAPDDCSTAVQEGATKSSCKLDRFGRKTKASRNADRPKAARLGGPPDRTLLALGWGWGGEFRIGTGQDGFESHPRPLHPDFKKKEFVDLAVGKRHTLFVSDDGLVFSVGEGLQWQLGTTSHFINHPERQAIQRLPKQVHPSGNLKAGKDYWVAQAAAGGTFSVTREANWEDATRATEGFLWMKESVKTLLEHSPSSESLNELWAHLLEEERTLTRRFQGRLLSWGSGQRGQLGLGDDIVDRRTPRVIRGLAGMPVRSVVAGAAHTLCVTLDGKVFSWGRGRDGRLGHGDYKDRWEPCRVGGLGPEPVALIAAGAAHSMAVSLPQSVHVWGRGAHGRLGTGDNKCRHEPVRLKVWPPGFPGCVVQDIALGGAHSIVLAHRSVTPLTLANPWRAESLAYAWGYGYCGQLGLGRQVEEVRTPSKIAFDKRELITSVVAGKSFSLAANIQGQMFAWGSGWTGQLGLGIARDSRVAPVRVDFPGVGRHLVVKLAAGERHASTLALSCSPPPRGWDKDKQWKTVVGSHVGMKKWEAGLLRLWRCPRRPRWTRPGPNPEPLFACITCGFSCVCRKCARSCHPGHDIRPCTRTLRVLCECGLRPFGWGSGDSSSGRSSNGVGFISGAGKEGRKTSSTTDTPAGGGNGLPAASPPAKSMRPALCRLLMTVGDEDDGGDTASWLNYNAVECQRLIRGWFGRRLARRRGEDRRRRRREAMEAVWYVTVLGAMEKSIARFDKDEERERNREGMAAADLESAFYRYYSKLQPVVMALNQQRQVLRDISTREGVTFETQASATDPRVARGLAPRKTITLWSRRAVRQLQRQLPPGQRLTEEKLVRLTAALPAGGDKTAATPPHPLSLEKARSGGGAGDERERERGGSGGAGGGYCGEAAGAGRLGGVADPDVDALLRSSQPLRKRRTVDIAGPEGLYRRVTRLRASQLRRLSSRRRASFSEGDYAARVDKSRSAEDLNWAQMLGRYWIGVDSSLGATRYLQIGDRKGFKLTDPQQLRWRRGARSLNKFLRTFGPGSIDPDVAAVKDRGRQGRAHSLCAPERVYAATVTWESRHRKLQNLLRAATKRGYPASGDAMKWTTRAERWGGLTPPPRVTAISVESLRRAAQRIVMRAAKRGWDLRPSTSQSRPGSGGNKLGGDPTTTPGSAVAEASSGSWSAHEDDDGNTFYVNDFTGESVWEIPPPATASTGLEARLEADGAETWDITVAAGDGEAAAWWDSGGVGGDGRETGEANCTPGVVDPNPFDGYDGPGAAQAEADAVGDTWEGEGELATTGWDQGDGGEDWTQEWDEGSQAYYWYNRRTGESSW